MSDLDERQRIERFAAPEAIASMLDVNIGEQQRMMEEASWLSRLLQRRLRQVRNGAWPLPLASVKEDNDADRVS